MSELVSKLLKIHKQRVALEDRTRRLPSSDSQQRRPLPFTQPSLFALLQRSRNCSSTESCFTIFSFSASLVRPAPLRTGEGGKLRQKKTELFKVPCERVEELRWMKSCRQIFAGTNRRSEEKCDESLRESTDSK